MMLGLISLEDVSGVSKVACRFPCVFCRRISFPFDQVQDISPTAFVIQDCLYFIFFFAIDNVWWGIRKVGSVYFVFFDWGEKGCVEHVVNTPLVGEFEPVGEWSEDFGDCQWPNSLWGHFLAWRGES